MAIAGKVYARHMQLSDEAKRYAGEIELRAKRKLGQILKETPKNKGLKGTVLTGTKREPVRDTLPTYKEIKLDKKLAAQAQKLANVPDGRFEEFLQSEGRDVPAG